MEYIIDTDTLKVGEFHPMASSALEYIKGYLFEEPTRIFSLKESMASCALAGNRCAEICLGTLNRILNGEMVGDRYVLGLAWFLIEMTKNEK